MKGTSLYIHFLLATELVLLCQSFSFVNRSPTGRGFPPPCGNSRGSSSSIAAAATGSDVVDANLYNVPLERAVELWTASVQESNNADRMAGVPYLDSKSKDYFVDDIPSVEVSRAGGLGMELLELAGGRDDGIGITIVSAVTEGGNAEAAGILPGDSVASVTVYETETNGLAEETRSRARDCEARDFDGTMDALANFPGDDASALFLDVKRMRRWPKVTVQVSYPPSQCAEGFDPVKNLEFFAGENLKRALQNRGIVLDDPGNPRCDYCGSNACYVSVVKGKQLLNPIGKTEEKLFQRNPNCRLSCKTTVGYNMQEGDLKLKVNLSQW
eukprot:CAMPEP_0172532926 /NCGR_PEP_ID=MMETSP1067-20121228/5796_1 /TAXON_ID=265564 ORGANISM="Thalassiosira punctigera, Strain Tpunct2005C2" /NCGR_SAMPLE_ID=MMETSP1067 /ASSEMBLY_ACC=CAM_ASM_000444 /LENGTH=327 /DNA_ID=CAMNT_0013317489 /DNA_START=106 /DNA_END=1089 /DNA_ORIENTATION=+